MVSKYSNEVWSSAWGNDYWLGLFINHMSSNEYGWDGSCTVAQTSLYENFEGSPPSSGDLDSEKQCAVAKKDTLEWRFEKCSISYVAICQTNLGACTYERDTTAGACSPLTVTSLMKSVADRDACERYCSEIKADDMSNGECWAVTYVPGEKLCVPSISRKPYDFDVGASKYSSSCGESVITSQDAARSSLISWKRCFESPGKDTTSIPSSSNSGSYTPDPQCIPVVITTTTTTTTTTTKPPTTTTTSPTTTTTSPTTTTTTATTTTTSPTTTTTSPTTTTTSPTTTTTTATTTTTSPTTTTTSPPTTTTSPMTTTTSPSITTTSPTTTTTSPTTTTTSPTTTTTSPTTTTTSPTTTVPSQNTASTVAACSCRCVIIANVSLEMKIAALQKELSVDKTKTSSYIRKFISASDERVSSKGIGMVLGAGVLISVFGVIVCGDLVNLFSYMYRLKTMQF